MKWFPHTECSGCAKPWAQTGGVRIVALSRSGFDTTKDDHGRAQIIESSRRDASAGVSLYQDSEHHSVKNLCQPARMFRLEDRYRQIVVSFWGAEWKPEWIDRGLQAAQQGTHPWLCQRCLHYVLCVECGNPRNRAPGADAIDDDGRRWHHPILPGDPACTTPGCPRNRGQVDERTPASTLPSGGGEN